MEVQPLLFEVWGGWAPPVVELLKLSAVERQNKLSKTEYDETTWAARTWAAFARQKLSVAVHLSVATEIAHALRMGAADPRGEHGWGVGMSGARGG